jgi:hypothetical protein
VDPDGAPDVTCLYHGSHRDPDAKRRTAPVTTEPIPTPPRGLPAFLTPPKEYAAYRDPAKIHADGLSAR